MHRFKHPNLLYSNKFIYLHRAKMYGNSYSNFNDTETDPGMYFRPHFVHQQKNVPIHNQFRPFQNDLGDHDIDMILAKSFYPKSYPVDFGLVNPFCPICGFFVKQEEKHRNFESKKFMKNFLSHANCLEKQEANIMLSSFEQGEQAKIIPFDLKKPQKSIPIGGQEFYLQLKLSHTLSDFVFLKLSTKASSSSSSVKWQIHQFQQTNPYIPNAICVPFTDFKMTLSMSQIRNGKKTVYKSYVNLGRLKYNQLKVVTASTQQMKVELRIFYDSNQKQKLINDMNFKYNYSLKLPVPIVQITAIQAMLPQDEDQQDRDFSSSVVNKVISENSSSIQTIQLISNTKPSSTRIPIDNPSQRSYQKEKIELEYLINNGSLGAFVRNNSQSRQFQNFLNEANARQVDLIIQALYLELPELITHQYANYMVQKLFSVCNYTQRLKVMQRLHQEISDIVRNKQGTHTIQALVKFFTNDEQFKLMCESIRQNFFLLSCHPNATHFIQKIIGLFPIIHTIQFFEYSQKNFLQFALDKNAMCVIKHMMRLISQLQKNNISVQIRELINQTKKKFINQVTFCIDKIIQDSFGNYIIQFCYQLFGEDKCTGITEMITQRFIQFAIQKYSSSVVFKCISSYWTRPQSFNRLRQTLTPESIIQLFRNKDGNKILLQIMQRHQHIPIRDKIYNQLVLGEMTKFNHDRWQVVLGIRSGLVGTQWTSFSDALGKSSPSKTGKKSKHYH